MFHYIAISILITFRKTHTNITSTKAVKDNKSKGNQRKSYGQLCSDAQ